MSRTDDRGAPASHLGTAAASHLGTAGAPHLGNAAVPHLGTAAASAPAAAAVPSNLSQRRAMLHPMSTHDPPVTPRIPLRCPEPHREMPALDLKLTWDATTDVAYLTLAPTGPADILGPTLLLETDREFAGFVSADFTVSDGRLVGFEVQQASACLPAAVLAAAERIDGEHAWHRVEQRVERRMRAVRSPVDEARRTH